MLVQFLDIVSVAFSRAVAEHEVGGLPTEVFADSKVLQYILIVFGAVLIIVVNRIDHIRCYGGVLA